MRQMSSQIEECTKRINFEIERLKKDPIYADIFQCVSVSRSQETFESIGGLEDVKSNLFETLILPNLRPDFFKGLRKPARGVLMYGPPGNGKTMIAKAAANESSGTFFSVSASTLVSKYVGESEKYMRSLFHLAYLMQPSIVFFDEVDSILTTRSGNENEASRRLKTEFLVQFDGMASWKNERVFLLAATNRPFDIDSAVLRRFDRRIHVPLPDVKTREIIIKNLLATVSHNLTEEQIEEVARITERYSGSDLHTVLRDASMEPLRSIRRDLIHSVSHELSPLSATHIQNSLRKISPSVTQNDIENIEKWEKTVKHI